MNRTDDRGILGIDEGTLKLSFKRRRRFIPYLQTEIEACIVKGEVFSWPGAWSIFNSVTQISIVGKKYCYGSMEVRRWSWTNGVWPIYFQGEYCHCDYCKCKHGYGQDSKGHKGCKGHWVFIFSFLLILLIWPGNKISHWCNSHISDSDHDRSQGLLKIFLMTFNLVQNSVPHVENIIIGHI